MLILCLYMRCHPAATMDFPFPYRLNNNGSWEALPLHKPSSFDSVCVFGFPPSFRLDDIRNLFCQKEGLCSCAYVPGHPQCVLIRFSAPSVAKRVLIRYDNAIIAGHKLFVYPANTGLLGIGHVSFLKYIPEASNNQPTIQVPSTVSASLPSNESSLVQDTKKPTELMTSYVGSTLWQEQGAYYANIGRTNGTLPTNSKYKHWDNPKTGEDGKRRRARRKESKYARKKRMYEQSKDESMKRKRKRRNKRYKAVTSNTSNTSKKRRPLDSDGDAHNSYQPSKAKKQAIDNGKYPISGHQFSKDKLSDNSHDLTCKRDRANRVSENTIKKENTLSPTSCDKTLDVVFPKKSPRMPELKSLKEKDISNEVKLENIVENENLDGTFLTEYLSLKNEVLLDLNSLSGVGDSSLELPLPAEPSVVETLEKNDTFVEDKLVGNERKDSPSVTEECVDDVDNILWNSAFLGCGTLVEKSSEHEDSPKLVLKKPSVEIKLGIKELQEILDKAREIDVKISEQSCENPVEVHEKSSIVEQKLEKNIPAATSGQGKKKLTKKIPNKSEKKLRKKAERKSRKDSTKGVTPLSKQTREENKEKFWKIFEFKKREVELEYERECSALLDVVKTLASKDQSLSDNLQKVVRVCLIELGDHLAEKLEAEMESVLAV